MKTKGGKNLRGGQETFSENEESDAHQDSLERSPPSPAALGAEPMGEASMCDGPPQWIVQWLEDQREKQEAREKRWQEEDAAREKRRLEEEAERRRRWKEEDEERQRRLEAEWRQWEKEKSEWAQWRDEQTR